MTCLHRLRGTKNITGFQSLKNVLLMGRDSRMDGADTVSQVSVLYLFACLREGCLF